MTDLIDLTPIISFQSSKKVNQSRSESLKIIISNILKKFNGYVQFHDNCFWINFFQQKNECDKKLITKIDIGQKIISIVIYGVNNHYQIMRSKDFLNKNEYTKKFNHDEQNKYMKINPLTGQIFGKLSFFICSKMDKQLMIIDVIKKIIEIHRKLPKQLAKSINLQGMVNPSDQVTQSFQTKKFAVNIKLAELFRDRQQIKNQFDSALKKSFYIENRIKYTNSNQYCQYIKKYFLGLKFRQYWVNIDQLSLIIKTIQNQYHEQIKIIQQQLKRSDFVCNSISDVIIKDYQIQSILCKQLKALNKVYIQEKNRLFHIRLAQNKQDYKHFQMFYKVIEKSKASYNFFDRFYLYKRYQESSPSTDQQENQNRLQIEQHRVIQKPLVQLYITQAQDKVNQIPLYQYLQRNKNLITYQTKLNILCQILNSITILEQYHNITFKQLNVDSFSITKKGCIKLKKVEKSIIYQTIQFGTTQIFEYNTLKINVLKSISKMFFIIFYNKKVLQIKQSSGLPINQGQKINQEQQTNQGQPIAEQQPITERQKPIVMDYFNYMIRFIYPNKIFNLISTLNYFFIGLYYLDSNQQQKREQNIKQAKKGVLRINMVLIMIIQFIQNQLKQNKQQVFKQTEQNHYDIQY